MKIRQHKILTQTLLILFIINFTLAAPAAVRERPDLDANVTRDVTAASQKRWDPLDEGASTNVPRAGDELPPGSPPPSAPPPSAPSPGEPPPPLRFRPILPRPSSGPSPSGPLLPVPARRPARRPVRRPLRSRPPSTPPTGLQPSSARLRRPSTRPPSAEDPSDLWQQVRTAITVARLDYINSLQPPPEHPESSTGGVLSSPRLTTTVRLGPGLSHLREGSMPGASSSTHLPPSTLASQPGPSEDHFPSPPGISANPVTSSPTGYQPASPGAEQQTHSVPSAEDQPNPGMQETHSVPSAEDQPNPGAMEETHSTEDMPPGFWDDVWKDLPGTFKDAFSKSNIKPRIFHHQDDTC